MHYISIEKSRVYPTRRSTRAPGTPTHPGADPHPNDTSLL